MAVIVPQKELFLPPILPICQVALPVTQKMKMFRNPTAGSIPVGLKPFKRASYEAMVRQGTASGAGDWKAVEDIKTAIFQSVEGVNRGIFGVPSAKKNEIEELVKQLESRNPTPYPTEDLRKVDGCWKLLYSTISILGVKRTKLGLRDFISLGDFLQTIDIAEGKAVNAIKFNVRGLKMFSGQLTVVASFKIVSKTRVDIEYQNSTIAPDELMNIFKKNYDILLAIFNPEGWLEITYVDETLRIGRDDKGNMFILERS